MVVNQNLNEEPRPTVPAANTASEDIGAIIKKNLELSEEILKLTRKINNHIKWSRVFSFFKLLIIVIPLVLGYLYLQPMINELLSFYQDLLGLKSNVESSNLNNIDLNKIDLNKLSPDVLNQIKQQLK